MNSWLLIRSTLVEGDNVNCLTWGVKNSAPREIRKAEQHIECHVSRVIGAMPFLWIAAADQPGPDSVAAISNETALRCLVISGKRRSMPHP